MNQPIAENPAVIDPRNALTASQQDALCALGFFRYQFRDRAGWQVGNKRFATGTIAALERKGLVRTKHGTSATVTQAGRIAIDRLKGERQ